MAEGPKVVGDLSEIYNPERLIATEEWYKANNKSARPQDVTVTDDELKKISFLQHPQQMMGIFKIPTILWTSVYVNANSALHLTECKIRATSELS